ncbi:MULTISPECIES: double-strand break repair helicase AddA [unclassified Sphingomonas]|uniref:double-strand break repair helicase AddA n=1 Tax=unclassified Sphingomonas TaxID=196159 RepID=UPI0006FD78B6|nr:MULTISPECIES: double-strand break repair helicase AddA [unclassified Sphingomonas]KQX25677.1 DNA helicase UvrD [Sphingomonas sp. Root1294]KQY66667.1 DNA helicase UvrD [Sphingomonas sp. Root50]KRB90449.1 DNA helicase UvrD [Sphingomonas sp. Root720]
MSGRLKPLDPLQPQQRAASDPAELVWLSASAGTGKTHVLTARVLRLLLGGASPDSILCLTFTKAGAAEMAERIHRRLAHWAGEKDDLKLTRDLGRLGEDAGPEALKRARQLFARVLEAPGGGLRIQTIHAFCQTLLAGFPAEAGLTPGFRPIEGREEAALARRTLAELLDGASRGGDQGLIRDVQALSLRLGEGGAEGYLLDCARAPDALAALGPREAIEPRLRHAFDVPLGDVEEAIERACADLDLDCFHAVARVNAAWGTASGLRDADIVAAFVAAGPKQRAERLKDVVNVVLTKDMEPRKYQAGLLKADAGYPDHCTRLADQIGRLLGWRARAELAAAIGAGLRAGQAYARAYAEAKRAAGLVDFDDLIRATVRLLDEPGMGDWVRYKLDQQTDHILVDEAQDTNADQWAIVGRLAEEFFVGAGARGGAARTIFTVGDFKQAIFGFQGTDPVEFERARLSFALKALQVDREFLDLSLDRSFRSAPAVLELVDRLIADLGHEEMGLFTPAERHAAHHAMPGRVTLLKPLSIDEAVDDEGEEGFIDDATRAYASRLARQVRAWIDEGLWLASKKRPIRPEDILILVRRRADLASLIVARLHAEQVPVAGVDRLRLTAPLVVKDLLAAVRFAVQREDDLSLAALLVSPLFGWAQDELYRVGFGRRGALIDAVRAKGDAGTVAALDAILARADFTTPYRFLENLLTGPLDGRRKLLRRLGAEARDPIDELLGAALQFEGSATATLQRFLDWFDRGDVEITRDPSAPLDAVRVMTVHGSKGLEAPLVILADATADPDLSPQRGLDWAIEEGALPVPVLRPRRAEMVEALRGDSETLKQRERQEHWRLLYVALTRAQEHLVIGGTLGVRARGVPPAASWYQAIERAMAGLGSEPVEDALWTHAYHYHGSVAATGAAAPARRRGETPVLAEPAWLRRPAAAEARPPRPLAPSSLGLDDVPDPPPSAAMRAAARRGTLLHALFERLPAVPPVRRREAARHWLLRSAGVEDEDVARALAEDACTVIADPRFAAIFGPDALAEAPVAAVVDGKVIAGTVDRLLVTADRILVVDFKTGRRAPADLAAAPRHHLRQMSAYAAALGVIFPGRMVEAALLYTAGPTLIDLPAAVLEAHKPGFRGQEQKQGEGR